MIIWTSKRDFETNDFIQWLEIIINTKIDKFEKVKKLYDYFNLNIMEFYQILGKNKEIGHISVNLANRNLDRTIREGFRKSIEKLNNLNRKLLITQDLINIIIYQLYGLDKDEFALAKKIQL